MLIQFHFLQNYAPSNLNRDDSGSPKDALFGGVKRGRISSQCLKRSIRHSVAFKEAFEKRSLLATRTKLLPRLVRDTLEEMGVGDDERQAIVARVPEIGRESAKKSASKAEDGELQTAQLIFLAPNEVRTLTEELLKLYQKHGQKSWPKVKIDEITKALGSSMPRSVDVAMFGRMTTSAAFEDIQAGVQVAHTLTTNGVEPEFDFFTAVDDISGESGAGMIGDVEFNSATHYKYLNIHWEQLLENLGGDIEIAQEAVLALLEGAALAQPTGKQNSFAAQNLPDFILVEVSERNLPVSYANAFLKPVRATHKKSLLDVSVDALDDYMSRLRRAYAINGPQAYMTIHDPTLTDVTVQESLPKLQDWLASHLPKGA